MLDVASPRRSWPTSSGGAPIGLRVTLGDLLGQPVMFEEDDDLDDVPAVRDALMAPGRLSRVIGSEARSDGVVDVIGTGRLVEFGWSDYQRGRLGNVIAQLPFLIRQAQHLEDSASQHGSPERRTAWTVSARAHHLAATTLSKVGEADLSWIAAERAMHAADQSDDVLVLASTARAAAHALLAVGRFDDAVEMGNTAARWLAGRLADADPAALSLLGMLHLRTAIAAARREDEALGLLLAAEREAPALVRHSAAVRETVKELQRRAPVTGVARSSELGGLAQRCRAAR